MRLALLLALILMTFSGAWAGPPSPKLSDRFVATSPAQEAGPLVFRDGNRKDVALRDFKGKWLVLNLWATWCASCVKEMASLNALPPLLGEKAAVVALAQDRQGAVVVPSFYQRHGLGNLKVYVDPDGSALPHFAAKGLPLTILINPSGQEVGRVEGDLDWSAAENVAHLRKLMGLKAP